MKIGKHQTSNESPAAFPVTPWTLILNSGTQDKQAQVIIEELCRRYWRPVYAYLRRKGLIQADAEDLTQGFFQEIVLGRNLVGKADPARGRFRTYLLTALERYLKDVYRAQTRSKRRPAGKTFPWDDFDNSLLAEKTASLTPEQAFQYAWLSELLNCVITEVQEECLSSNIPLHWQIFCERLLHPIINNQTALSLPEICQKYAIESESRASNMVITVKRRLRKVLERRLRQYAIANGEMEQEISDLLAFFS